MHDITVGDLQATYIRRAAVIKLPPCHLVCPGRGRDSFVYILSGRCDYHFQDGTEIALNGGEVMYLPLGVVYSMDVHSEGHEYIIFDFDCPQQELRQHFTFRPANPQWYERTFRKLTQVYLDSQPSRMAKCMCLLFEIYIRIIEDYHPRYIRKDSKEKILSAQQYILNNLTDEKLSVSYLAQLANMSAVHFRRLFLEVYGESPVAYIANARIEHAKSLLEIKGIKIEDVAALSGYSSTRYFSAVFKAATGLTPSSYRKKYFSSNIFPSVPRS